MGWWSSLPFKVAQKRHHLVHFQQSTELYTYGLFLQLLVSSWHRIRSTSPAWISPLRIISVNCNHISITSQSHHCSFIFGLYYTHLLSEPGSQPANLSLSFWWRSGLHWRCDGSVYMHLQLCSTHQHFCNTNFFAPPSQHTSIMFHILATMALKCSLNHLMEESIMAIVF